MSKTIINGIDVSECIHLDEWKHCNICKELIKTIPDRHQCVTEQDLRCEYYSNCYFKQLKRLQEENKRLQMLSCANCGEKYLSPDGAELYEKNVQLQQENEKLKNKNNDLIEEIASVNIDIAILQKENEKLKERFNELYNNAEQLANKYNKYGSNKENELVEIINKTTDEMNKYKQALEEIRKITNEYITYCMGSKCEGMEEIQNKINEVLNDRN